MHFFLSRFAKEPVADAARAAHARRTEREHTPGDLDCYGRERARRGKKGGSMGAGGRGAALRTEEEEHEAELVHREQSDEA